VALAGFAIDSLIEILACTMGLWQLRGTDASSRTPACASGHSIAFALLAIYIAVQSAVVLANVIPADRSPARSDLRSPRW
jgi:hypothetical protein